MYGRVYYDSEVGFLVFASADSVSGMIMGLMNVSSQDFLSLRFEGVYAFISLSVHNQKTVVMTIAS